jgi:hypothetical protein
VAAASVSCGGCMSMSSGYSGCLEEEEEEEEEEASPTPTAMAHSDILCRATRPDASKPCNERTVLKPSTRMQADAISDAAIQRFCRILGRSAMVLRLGVEGVCV